MQVDWAGQTVPYTNAESNQVKLAYIFVAVLPASAYPFVYAFANTKLPNWIDAHVKAYEYFGGVPKVTVPDNTKTAVKKPDLIDPVPVSYTHLDVYKRQLRFIAILVLFMMF